MDHATKASHLPPEEPDAAPGDALAPNDHRGERRAGDYLTEEHFLVPRDRDGGDGVRISTHTIASGELHQPDTILVPDATLSEPSSTGEPPGDKHPGAGGDPDGMPADLWMRAARPDLHVLHQEQLPKDVLAMPVCDGRRSEGMRLLSVVPLPTNGGSQLLETPGGREGTEEGCLRHHHSHGTGRVRAQGHDEGGIEQVPGEGDLQDVPQVSERRGPRQGQGEVRSKGTNDGTHDCTAIGSAITELNVGRPINQLDSGGQRHLPPIQGVHEVAEQPMEPRLMRKIKGALTQSASFWKIIKDLLSSTGLDDDATTEKLKRLHAEVAQEFLEHPAGTKRLKRIADAFHLSVRNLKLVTEVYNPGCFEEAIRKNKLTPGIAFDITLGYDLLQPQAQEQVREYLRHMKPGLVLLAPPCHMYSQLQNLSKNKRETDSVLMARYLVKRKAADKLLAFAAELCNICIEMGSTFVLEHPWAARSWQTKPLERLLRRNDTFISRCDQCYFGLRGEDGSLQRKRTGFLSNNRKIYESLDKTCDDQHSHQHIVGGQRARRAQAYPEMLKETIVQAYAAQIGKQPHRRTSHEILQQDLAYQQLWTQTFDEATEPWETLPVIDLDEETAAGEGLGGDAAGDGDDGEEAAGEEHGPGPRAAGDDHPGPVLPGQRRPAPAAAAATSTSPRRFGTPA